MPLPDPTFDHRCYQDILDEALARIPVHNPEWTNLNDADPGVTLLQLFAFMTESLIYRANLIPERNRRKFLRLLDLGLRPAQAARGMVTFSLPGSVHTPVMLPAGAMLRAGPVPFRTENGLSVLPIEARSYYKAPLPQSRREEAAAAYKGLYASYLPDDATGDDTTELEFYETRVFAPPASGLVLPTLSLNSASPGSGPIAEDGRLRTTDGYLWLALLAQRPDEHEREADRNLLAQSLLTVGVVATAGPAGKTLGGDQTVRTRDNVADLIFEVPDLPTTDTPPGIDQTPTPVYRALRVTAQSGNLLAGPGTVELDLRPPVGRRLGTWDDLDPLETGVGAFPPSLDLQPDEKRLLSWIRVRVANADLLGSDQLNARINWIGVNAAEVVQRTTVDNERLGIGIGEPDQVVRLINTPVLPDSLTLSIGGEPWSPIDDLTAAPAEVPTGTLTTGPSVSGERAVDSRVYRLDPESGEIRFGDGAHGMRPPAGALIQASYAYGGGLQGMVGIDTIRQGPAGVKVTNPVPTWGGDAGETVADGERRLPAFIRHRDRLVSADDYREITWRTPGVELGRVEPLPLVHPDQPEQVSEGLVTLMVIPAQDAAQPRAPRPDPLFLGTVCSWLEPRRILTTELHVRGPVYVGILVTVGIDTLPGRDQASVRGAVRSALERFLSPLTGGFEGTGWPLGKTVETLELWAEAARVPGVAKVNGVRMAETSGTAHEDLRLVGLQLPHLVGLLVGVGSPPPLETLLGAPEVAGLSQQPGAEAPDGTVAGSRPRLPVPVIPEGC